MPSPPSHPDISRRAFVAGAVATLGAPSILRGVSPPVRTELSLPPFLARPTATGILVNTRAGADPVTAAIEVREGTEEWRPGAASIDAAPHAFVNWTVEGLEAATRYEYRIRLTTADGNRWTMARGTFRTRRTAESDAFAAALITDAHVGTFEEGTPPLQVTDDVIRNASREQPEFVIALGDNVAWATARDQPQETTHGAERAYTMYRRHVGPLTGSCPHFGVIGNWEGETGKFPRDAIETVSSVRHRYTPNPMPTTYAEGGSDGQDYYAFSWGPALFVVLNVQTYTRPSGPTDNPRDDVVAPDEWTLGTDQFAWAERTLTSAAHPFRFVCIHHAVGGNGGTPRESRYGRGGARAAAVGEQRLLHELMRESGVQIMFYGHDHVFVDDVVDGIHYALPGSFGAPWRFERRVTGYERYWGDAGHARLTVTPREARVSYVNLAGHLFHSFAVTPA